MNCSCNVNTAYEGETTGYCERTLKAAKQHMCYDCGTTINKGDYYTFCTRFGEGTVSNYKLCSDCQQLTSVFFKDGWMFGTIIDDLQCYLDDYWSEDLPSDCISKLSPRNKALVCDHLQYYQEKK